MHADTAIYDGSREAMGARRKTRYLGTQAEAGARRRRRRDWARQCLRGRFGGVLPVHGAFGRRNTGAENTTDALLHCGLPRIKKPIQVSWTRPSVKSDVRSRT
jgi:hypothetical protein